MRRPSSLVLIILTLVGSLSLGLVSRWNAPAQAGEHSATMSSPRAPKRLLHGRVGMVRNAPRCRPVQCGVHLRSGHGAVRLAHGVPVRLAQIRDTGRLERRIKLHRHRVGDIFGVGSFIMQRSGPVSRLMVDRARLLGVRWVREEFTATRLHMSLDGAYQWAPFDRVIVQERRAGLRVLGLLDYSNTWGYRNHGWMPHRDIARLSNEFARYAFAVAWHYRHQVRYWQVWNEPDLTAFWHPRPNPNDYARLLTSAYHAIKRANPAAKVVMAGTSGVDITFLRRVVEHTREFDILSVHPYRNDPERNLLQQIRTLQLWHKPIWFSEIGWAAGEGCTLCTDQESQARYLVRFYALAAAAGVQRVFWYDLRDDAHSAVSPEAHFGLMRHDLSGKPAFGAFAFLARLLRGATFVHADRSGSNGVYILRFTSPAGPFAVLWNLGEADGTVAFPWSSGAAQAYDLRGVAQADLAVKGGRTSLNLQAGGNPMYVLTAPIRAPIQLPRALLHPPPPPPARRHVKPESIRRVTLHASRGSLKRMRSRPRPYKPAKVRANRPATAVQRGAWAVPGRASRVVVPGSRTNRARERSVNTPTVVIAPLATPTTLPTPRPMTGSPTAVPTPRESTGSPTAVPPVTESPTPDLTPPTAASTP